MALKAKKITHFLCVLFFVLSDDGNAMRVFELFPIFVPSSYNISASYMKPLAKKSNYLAKTMVSWTFARAVPVSNQISSTPVVFSNAV